MHSDTAGLGRRPDLAAELAALGDPTLTAGRVLAQHRGRWIVAEAGGEDSRPVSARGPLRDASARIGEPQLLPARGRLRETPPATGDWVAIDAGGAIAALLERRGTIVRQVADATTTPQVLAANVDLALLVEPAPHPNERRLERLVAVANGDGVAAALVLTKADLEPDAAGVARRPGDVEAGAVGPVESGPQLRATRLARRPADVDARTVSPVESDPQLHAARLARRLGVMDAVAVSAVTGDGIGVLRSLLVPGATAVLLGVSGAGKSTLVNALLGEQRQLTQPVRAGDGRGRHTTVTRELIALPDGALLIDTPGVRKVGVWDGPGASFADIDALAAECRFADCRHDTEPGCAVREAVDADRIAAWRKLAREQAWLDDRKAAAREREQRGRAYPALQRAARRAKGDR